MLSRRTPFTGAVPRVVLASASPRRRILLRHLVEDFDVATPGVDEDVPPGTPPHHVVRLLARRKAQAVAAVHPDAVVLAADTVVVVGGRLVGKVEDEAAARRMLLEINHRPHQVWSGVAVVAAGRLVAEDAVLSVVRLHLSPPVLDAYVRSGAWRGKAGAYGCQDPELAPHVTVEDGPWSNVVGLPLAATARLLEAAGVDVGEPPVEADLRARFGAM